MKLYRSPGLEKPGNKSKLSKESNGKSDLCVKEVKLYRPTNANSFKIRLFSDILVHFGQNISKLWSRKVIAFRRKMYK